MPLKFSDLLSQLAQFPAYGQEWHEHLRKAARQAVEIDQSENCECAEPFTAAICEILSNYDLSGWQCHIEGGNPKRISGWVKRKDSDLPQFIRLKINNEFLPGHIAASDFRKDLLEQNIGDGRYGWQLKPASPLPPYACCLAYSPDGKILGFRFYDFIGGLNQQQAEAFADAALKAAKPDTALAWFNELARLYPKENKYLLAMAECLTRLDKINEAITTLKKFIAAGGEIQASLCETPLANKEGAKEANLKDALDFYLRSPINDASLLLVKTLPLFNKLFKTGNAGHYKTIFNNILAEKLRNSADSGPAKNGYAYLPKRKLAFFTGGTDGFNFMLPIIKCLPKSCYDILIERRNPGRDQEQFERLGLTENTILFHKDKLAKYDTIMFDQNYLYGHPNLQPFPQAKFCIYSHGTDSIFLEPGLANLAFCSSASQIRMNNKLARENLTDANKQALEKRTVYKKCEYGVAGPFHIGNYLDYTPDDKPDLVSRLEQMLGITINCDKPLVLFMEDEITPVADLVACLNQLAPYVTIIAKFIARTLAKISGLDPNIIIYPASLGHAPNLARYAADIILCGADSGSFTTSIMLGLTAIPYYAKILDYKFWNGRKGQFNSMREYHIANPDYNPLKHRLFYNWQKLFNIADTESILSAITQPEYSEWYQQNLPELQQKILGYYPRKNCHEIAADYLLRFHCDGTLGKDAFAYYLKD